MTSLTLKWIALLTMAFDHVGAVFFPQLIWIRYIGRISFPIFAFLLVQGYIHTSSKPKYLFRLGVFALISEIPFDLALYNGMWELNHQNIFFELILGFLALIFAEQAIKKKNPIYILGCLLALATSLLINASYGLYGICIILAFYLFRKFRGADALALVALTYLFYGLMNYDLLLFDNSYNILQLNSVQIYAVAACVPIVFYSGKPGKKKMKQFFYMFYPVHLIIIWLVKYFLNGGEVKLPWA